MTNTDASAASIPARVSQLVDVAVTAAEAISVRPSKPKSSRPLDVHRWSDYPELNDCLTKLVADIEGSETRARRRSAVAAKRFRDAVRCLVLDLYVAWSADPESVVGVALGKDNFKRGTRYDALFLTYDAFHPAFIGLVELGYVQRVQRGFHDPRTGKGFVTRVRATLKLIELLIGQGRLTMARLSHRTDKDAKEVIILRDRDHNDDKYDLEYEDTKLTRQMRSDLMRINAALEAHWLDLYLTDNEIDALNARMANGNRSDHKEPSHVDLAAKRLRRIFNNGSWTEGGRFYGGWWQTVPKEYRPLITINDKRTVEVDYSVMHPALMYAEVGATLEGDAYDIGVTTVKRDLIKQTFNQLVNAEGRTNPKSDFNEQECGMSWKELQELVKARHRPIAKFLGTGHGVRLQNKDAQIANRIMLRFLDMGHVCLPIHDSFIVHHALQDELTTIMHDEFHNEVGAHIGTKPKIDLSGAITTDSDNVRANNVDTIGELLSPTGEYAGYETRLLSWWDSRV